MGREAHQFELDEAEDLPPELLRFITALARAHVDEDYAAAQAATPQDD